MYLAPIWTWGSRWGRKPGRLRGCPDAIHALTCRGVIFCSPNCSGICSPWTASTPPCARAPPHLRLPVLDSNMVPRRPNTFWQHVVVVKRVSKKRSHQPVVIWQPDGWYQASEHAWRREGFTKLRESGGRGGGRGGGGNQPCIADLRCRTL